MQPLYHFDPITGTYISVNPQHTPGFSFQNLLNSPIGNSEVEAATRERKRKTKSTKNSNSSQASLAKKDWTKEEEIALTKAWLYISEDADIGTNQKGAAMWDRILEVWRESMGTECNLARNNNSLQLKWSKIQGAVSKFHSLYERLERHPQSGTNSEDLIINAMRSYEDLHDTPFKFIDCWKILIKNPKWCSKELTKAATSTKQVVDHKMSTMTGEAMATNGDVDVPVSTNIDGIERPEGRKKCKEKKRKLNEEKGVVDALNKLQCTLEKQISVNQANLEMKRENEEKELKLREEVMRKELELKEKAQKMKEEMYRMKMREQRRQEQDRLMNQDLSKLSPTRRAYYELRKIEILKEMENEFSHGSNMSAKFRINSYEVFVINVLSSIFLCFFGLYNTHLRMTSCCLIVVE
ncbi:NAM-like protein-like [Striga asiatica]|uniref:NAM-like protein-like n=1 Tax=Striga asiatica TaxID=4170 RepID=A0A5A7P4P1_STRAF|nr:NAM-like protein-like [Striga asiatica]